MSATNLNRSSFSADVRMHLRVNGQIHSIGQLGPDFVILNDPLNHPPGEAEIAMSIDGRERRWTVYLPDGIVLGKLQTRIALRQ